jgi:Ca2+-binding RTX toxin-like protein
VVVTLNGATGAVATVGGAAEDTLRNIESVYGGSASDNLTGDDAANTLLGFAGNDVFKGGGGADVLQGGIGIDTADYRDKTTAVVVTLNGGVDAAVSVGGVVEDTIRESRASTAAPPPTR